MFKQFFVLFIYLAPGFTKRCTGFQGPFGEFVVMLPNIQRQTLPSGVSLLELHFFAAYLFEDWDCQEYILKHFWLSKL